MIGIDTHAHVFAQGLTLAEDRRYTPEYEALVEDYLRQLDGNGLSHGVLVQPSFLGSENGYMLGVLRRHPDRLRGVAVVGPDVAEAALAELAEGGVVGIRLSLVGRPLPDLRSRPWWTLTRRVADLGWHVELRRQARDLPGLIAPLLNAGVSVVIGHFGHPDPGLGVADPGFRHLLSMAGSDRVWIKLPGAYRNGGPARGEAVARDAVPLLRRAFGPSRLLWGSDWPHTGFEGVAAFRDSCASLDVWLPDATERAAALVDAPLALFRFASWRDRAHPALVSPGVAI